MVAQSSRFDCMELGTYDITQYRRDDTTCNRRLNSTHRVLGLNKNIPKSGNVGGRPKMLLNKLLRRRIFSEGRNDSTSRPDVFQEVCCWGRITCMIKQDVPSFRQSSALIDQYRRNCFNS